jgi:hypothetical protein
MIAQLHAILDRQCRSPAGLRHLAPTPRSGKAGRSRAMRRPFCHALGRSGQFREITYFVPPAPVIAPCSLIDRRGAAKTEGASNLGEEGHIIM